MREKGELLRVERGLWASEVSRPSRAQNVIKTGDTPSPLFSRFASFRSQEARDCRYWPPSYHLMRGSMSCRKKAVGALVPCTTPPPSST